MQPGAIINKRYQLSRPVGAGAMGEVWEAYRLEDRLKVAVKLMKPEALAEPTALRRFLREAIAASETQRSEHVVRVFDVGGPLYTGAYYMVQEFVEGESLRDLLDREGALVQGRAVELIVQACEGLAEVHGQGIIHRDIKPENLMLTRDARGRELIKLVDFGISKFRRSPDGETATLTKTGQLIGTPLYLAPERIDPNIPWDHRADIYSLGVVLYEMLTGRSPFLASDLRHLVFAILQDRPTPPHLLKPGVHEALSTVVLRAMAREVEARYHAVDELAAALRPFSWVKGRPGAMVEGFAIELPEGGKGR